MVPDTTDREQCSGHRPLKRGRRRLDEYRARLLSKRQRKRERRTVPVARRNERFWHTRCFTAARSARRYADPFTKNAGTTSTNPRDWCRNERIFMSSSYNQELE